MRDSLNIYSRFTITEYVLLLAMIEPFCLFLFPLLFPIALQLDHPSNFWVNINEYFLN